MSINSINYKKNKMIFSKLIGQKYKIIKDPHDKNTLVIKASNNRETKCKYLLLLTEKKLNNDTNDTNDKNLFKNSLIIWSDSNPYIDQYTREISEIIRKSLLKEKKYLLSQNNQLISKSDLKDLVISLIKNQYNFMDKLGKSINCNWILTSVHNNIIEYYMITDIIYY